EEQLVEREPPLAQALLDGISREPLEIVPVALREPIFPGVLAEDGLLLLPGLPIPGKRNDARVLHSLHGELLGALERLVHVDRNPGMAFDDLLLDADHVHDRKYAGPLIERDLLLLVVGKEAADALVSHLERIDQIGREQRVDLALR